MPARAAIRALRALALGLGLLATASLAQQQNTVEQAAAVADPAVGRVVVEDGDGNFGFGSGLVLSGENGVLMFLTNHHVIEGAQAILVGFNQEGAVFGYTARVVAESARLDLAVLEMKPAMDVSAHKVSLLPLRLSLARKGEGVVALGFPGTSDYLGTNGDDPDFYVSTLTSGSVSRITHGSWGSDTPSGDKFDIVQHTAAINPGNSGGPLIDLCAQLVGLNTRVATQTSAGNAANDTYWANSAPVIAAFLDQEGVPFQRADACDPSRPLRSLPPAIARTPTWMIAVLGLILTLSVLGGIGGISYLHKRRGGFGERVGAVMPGSGSTAQALALEFGNGQRHTLDRDALMRGQTIGRGEDADLQIEGAGVSRVHARIQLEGRRLMLTDLGSTNKTRVDGKVLVANQPVPVMSRSRITLGSETLSLRQVRGGAP